MCFPLECESGTYLHCHVISFLSATAHDFYCRALLYIHTTNVCSAFLRALQQMKLRLKGAQKGHSLLKRKADALTLRFRQILAKIIEVIENVVPHIQFSVPITTAMS